MFKRRKIFLFAITLWACSCVEPFETFNKSSLRIMVVDGMLTDEDTQQKIKIQATVHENETIYTTEIPNLKVELIINGKENVSFLNQGGGIYALPLSFRAKVWNSYQLKFQKSDGTKYESINQEMPDTPKIDKIYDEFEVNGIEKGVNKIPANYIYVDFKDPVEQKNYYLWTWTLWERQYVCRTEFNYDYYCKQNCWEILHNEDWNIFSDIYSNGRPVIGKLVAKIPYYQMAGSLFEIKQLGISQETYRFLKLISDQTERTGTLVETPPAAIVGNVKNLTNPSELITGTFIVASSSTLKYWLNRTNAVGKVQPIGLLGRKPNPTTNNVTYVCIEGPNRTPTKPRGWID